MSYRSNIYCITSAFLFTFVISSQADTLKSKHKTAPEETKPHKVDLLSAKPCADPEMIQKYISRLPRKTQFQTDESYGVSAAKVLVGEFGDSAVAEKTCKLSEKFRYEANKQIVIASPYQSSIIQMTENPKDPYVANNALGAAVSVKSSVQTIYEIKWPYELSPNIEISAPIKPEAAEREFENITLAMLATPVPPFAYHADILGNPTYSFPYDIEKDT